MTQYPNWSQMSMLPNSLLEDDEAINVTWDDLRLRWNPERTPFISSIFWKAALNALNIPIDEVHLGLSIGLLKPPFSDCNLSIIQENTKAHTLIVQITSAIKDRAMRVSDMTGDAMCSVHPKVISNYPLQEGCVLALKDITILPGKILNLTESNILKIFMYSD